jgi:hypothetical protein
MRGLIEAGTAIAAVTLYWVAVAAACGAHSCAMF